MTILNALVATWAACIATVLVVFIYTLEWPAPRWLRPACLIGLAILLAASLVVIWSGVRL